VPALAIREVRSAWPHTGSRCLWSGASDRAGWRVGQARQHDRKIDGSERARGVDGYSIRTVQELLGHSDVSTTMVYTLVRNKGGRGVLSPLDAL